MKNPINKLISKHRFSIGVSIVFALGLAMLITNVNKVGAADPEEGWVFDGWGPNENKQTSSCDQKSCNGCTYETVKQKKCKKGNGSCAPNYETVGGPWSEDCAPLKAATDREWKVNVGLPEGGSCEYKSKASCVPPGCICTVPKN